MQIFSYNNRFSQACVRAYVQHMSTRVHVAETSLIPRGP